VWEFGTENETSLGDDDERRHLENLDAVAELVALAVLLVVMHDVLAKEGKVTQQLFKMKAIMVTGLHSSHILYSRGVRRGVSNGGGRSLF
jgi:hypothetical protein